MKKNVCYCLLFFITLFCTNHISGQTRSFDSYTNELLFNVFREKPDTSVVEFLKLYIPGLLKKQAGSSTAVAGQQKAEEVHSMVFYKHPFFPGKFAVGKLQFFCTRFIPSNTVEVYDVSLALGFDDPVSAEQAFSDLIENYLPLSTSKHISSEVGCQNALFSDSAKTGFFHTVQIRMCRDNLQKNNYQVLLQTHQ